MTDHHTSVAEAAAAQSAAPSQQETVSYDRFKQVNDKLQAEVEARKAIDAELKRLQRQGQSEIERAIAERDDALAAITEANAARDEALAQIEQQRRATIVRDAATAAGFFDPTDAVARLAGADLKTAAAAEREVKALAAAAPHLVRAHDESAGRKLERVLENGQNPEPAGQSEQREDPAAQQLLAQIQNAQASSWTSAPVN